MVVQRLRAVDQVITAFFNHICPTAATVCCAFSQKYGRLFLYEVLKCVRIRAFHDRSPIEGPPPHSPRASHARGPRPF
jgi:hypothetical protein